jgi:hypothetical protein
MGEMLRKDYGSNAIVPVNNEVVKQVNNLNTPFSIQQLGAERSGHYIPSDEISFATIVPNTRVLVGNQEGLVKSTAFTGGTAEVASLLVTAAATATENVTVTLGGVSTNVAVIAADTAIAVADKIRAASFPGWTTGGTVGTATVTFTATKVGVKTDAIYAAGTTGSAGTMSTSTQGVDGTLTTVTLAFMQDGDEELETLTVAELKASGTYFFVKNTY